MLLFPMGSLVTLINHYRTFDADGGSSTTSKSKPNAYLTWNKGSLLANQHAWHDMSVNQLADLHRIGLVMSVKAMEDIAEGDEYVISKKCGLPLT